MTRGRKRFPDSTLNPRDPSELPDIDRLMRDMEPIFQKVCHDIKKNWWWQLRIPEIDLEIRQTVMLVFANEWNLFRNGFKDQFPPTAGFLYTTAWYRFLEQFAPKDDLVRWMSVEPYNTLESGDVELLGVNIIPGFILPIVADGQQIPPPRDETDERRANLPDMVDLWCFGFSLTQLAVIYNLHPETIRVRLHQYYDALEAVGSTVSKPRPPSRNRKNRRIQKTQTPHL